MNDISKELSSDDEHNMMEDDVLLEVIKCPCVECCDILQSDDEFPLCLTETKRKDTLNVEEKSGVIQEYIKIGAGIIFFQGIWSCSIPS